MSAKTDHHLTNQTALVRRLIQAAEEEENLLLLLGEAVGRGDDVGVFRIASEITGRAASASASADLHIGPSKQQHKTNTPGCLGLKKHTNQIKP